MRGQIASEAIPKSFRAVLKRICRFIHDCKVMLSQWYAFGVFQGLERSTVLDNLLIVLIAKSRLSKAGIGNGGISPL
jgi:hypothetical protein